jgi:hypothetical protein
MDSLSYPSRKKKHPSSAVMNSSQSCNSKVKEGGFLVGSAIVVGESCINVFK